MWLGRFADRKGKEQASPQWASVPAICNRHQPPLQATHSPVTAEYRALPYLCILQCFFAQQHVKDSITLSSTDNQPSHNNGNPLTTPPIPLPVHTPRTTLQTNIRVTASLYQAQKPHLINYPPEKPLTRTLHDPRIIHISIGFFRIPIFLILLTNFFLFFFARHSRPGGNNREPYPTNGAISHVFDIAAHVYDTSRAVQSGNGHGRGGTSPLVGQESGNGFTPGIRRQGIITYSVQSSEFRFRVHTCMHA